MTILFNIYRNSDSKSHTNLWHGQGQGTYLTPPQHIIATLALTGSYVARTQLAQQAVCHPRTPAH